VTREQEEIKTLVLSEYTISTIISTIISYNIVTRLHQAAIARSTLFSVNHAHHSHDVQEKERQS